MFTAFSLENLLFSEAGGFRIMTQHMNLKVISSITILSVMDYPCRFWIVANVQSRGIPWLQNQGPHVWILKGGLFEWDKMVWNPRNWAWEYSVTLSIPSQYKWNIACSWNTDAFITERWQDLPTEGDITQQMNAPCQRRLSGYMG